MERLERDALFPAEMQGRWTEVDDPTSELIVDGGEITCFGAIVSYDYKLIGTEEGALTVRLKIDDPPIEAEDTFQRADITGLVFAPEARFSRRASNRPARPARAC